MINSIANAQRFLYASKIYHKKKYVIIIFVVIMVEKQGRTEACEKIVILASSDNIRDIRDNAN